MMNQSGFHKMSGFCNDICHVVISKKSFKNICWVQQIQKPPGMYKKHVSICGVNVKRLGTGFQSLKVTLEISVVMSTKLFVDAFSVRNEGVLLKPGLAVSAS